MTAIFKDYFSTQSRAYAGYRPGYPEALFDWLASITPGHELAWDCATGSGQAAISLARRFSRVIATDASAAQIEHAQGKPNIVYRVAPAEQGGLDSGSADLVTVAQALHWFDFDAFHAEVDRVLKPGGIIAVWCYGLHRISPEVDRVIDRFYTHIVGEYWPPERSHIEHAYRDIPFPFRKVVSPDFELNARWTLDGLLGYLGTWSAARRFIKARGKDPRELIVEPLTAAWGDPRTRRQASWSLMLRAGSRGRNSPVQHSRERKGGG